MTSREGMVQEKKDEEGVVKIFQSSLGSALICMHGCALPVRKDCGLKSPDSQTTLGRDRS